MSGERHADGTPHVVVVQCTDSKRDEPAQAGDIYDRSPYFRKQRRYAERFGDFWFIQSAKHGLLEPGEVIEPYNKRPKHIDDVQAWAADIANDLAEYVPPASTIDLLGGRAYTNPLTPELEARGFDVCEPLRGMKFGRRMSKLDSYAQG